MTAIELREYYLRCNGDDCEARYNAHAPTRFERKALRKAAVRDGWTHVRSDRGRKYDADFCPDHKPAGEPS